MTGQGRVARLGDEGRKEVRARLLPEDYERLVLMARDHDRSVDGEVRWIVRQALAESENGNGHRP